MHANVVVVCFLSMLQCNTMQYKFPAEVEISCVSHRYTAVAMPMLYNTRYSSRRRVTVMISVVWVLSFAISCPLLFGLNNTGKKKAAVSHLFFFVWLECVLNGEPLCLQNCLLTLHRTTSFHPVCVGVIKCLPQSVVLHSNCAFSCNCYCCTAAYTVMIFFLTKKICSRSASLTHSITVWRRSLIPWLFCRNKDLWILWNICFFKWAASQHRAAVSCSTHESGVDQQEPLELEQSICVEHFKQRFSQHSSS